MPMNFSHSLFITQASQFEGWKNVSVADAVKLINGDPLVDLFRKMRESYQKENQAINDIQAEIDDLQRTYMAAQMEVFKDRKFYPDANGTLRVTYGKVNGYKARDAVYYTPVTYLEGVRRKVRAG